MGRVVGFAALEHPAQAMKIQNVLPLLAQRAERANAVLTHPRRLSFGGQ